MELARLRQRADELSKQVDAETGHLQDIERANRERQARADEAFVGCGLRAPDAGQEKPMPAAPPSISPSALAFLASTQ